MSVTTALLAVLSGVILGLLGGGGSILTVPMLVYILRYDPKLAIVMSLPVVGFASLVGGARHAMLGNVAPRIVLPFGLATMTGAFAGARLAGFFTAGAQLVLLAVIMLGAAVSMFRSASLLVPAEAREPHLSAATLAIGLGVGVLTAIVGVGGGFLMVPALVVLAGLSMHQAIGTSLVVIAMNAAAGYLGYHGRYEVPWGVVGLFAGFSAAGILGGSALASRLPQHALKRGFAVLLLFLGTFILWQRSPLH